MPIINKYETPFLNMNNDLQKLVYWIEANGGTIDVKDVHIKALEMLNVNHRNNYIKVSNKMLEAEAAVDKFIGENNRPPRYREVQNILGLSKTAVYQRLRHCRHKMKSL